MNFKEYLESFEKDGRKISLDSDNVLEKKWVELVPAKTRKEKGQYPTPIEIARFMIKFALEGGEIRSFLDPSAGCGILSRVFIKEMTAKRIISEEIRMALYDVDKTMVDAARINLDQFDVKIDIFHKDFLEESNGSKYDLIFANPPYVKSNRIEKKGAYLEKLEKVYRTKLDGTIGLDSIFLLSSIQRLSDRGKLVFIIPCEFLNSGYGEHVKTLLLSHLDIEYLIYFDTRELSELVFEDGMSSTLIIVARKRGNGVQKDIQFVKMQKWNDLADEFVKIIDDRLEEPNKIIKIHPSLLHPDDKWTSLFEENDWFKAISKEFVPMLRYFDTKRGIATGANFFFTLSGKEAKEWDIPQRYLKKILTKANHANPPQFSDDEFERLKSTGKKVYLLDIREETGPEAVKRYLAHGIEKEVNTRYLTSSKKRWYYVDRRVPADILVKVFNRGDVDFIVNRTDCLNLTCFHGIYKKSSEDTYSKLLAIYLNSKFGKEAIRLQLRPYGGGLKKLEPGDVEKILVPDFKYLEKGELTPSSEFYDAWVKSDDFDGSRADEIVEKLIANVAMHKSSKKVKEPSNKRVKYEFDGSITWKTRT